jgi:integrase
MKNGVNKHDLKTVIEGKLRESNTLHGSNPALSAVRSYNFQENELVWQQTVAVSKKTYARKYARLVDHGGDLTKRWYVIYYGWNVATHRLQRVRLFEPLNRINSLPQRLSIGQQMVRIVNGQLDAGKVLGKDELAKLTKNLAGSVGKLTVLGALDYVKEQKKRNGHRENYYRTFSHVKFNLAAWLEFTGQPDYDLKQFTREDAREFFTYLRDEKKLSNKSINNVRGTLTIAFNFLQQENVIWKKFPLDHIDLLPVVTTKHAAYSDDQITLIKKEIAKRNTPKARQLQTFIHFIYYLFIRPNEAVQLQVGHILLKDNRVLIPGAISKTKFDEFIEIPLQVRRMLEEEKLCDYPGDYFVFGLGGHPSKVGISAQTFWKLHKKILEATGLKALNDNFTLYSYKHSGVISLYKSCKDIKQVQRQCRHKTLEQTNTYLRDLGALESYDQLQGWQGAV